MLVKCAPADGTFCAWDRQTLAQFRPVRNRPATSALIPCTATLYLLIALQTRVTLMTLRYVGSYRSNSDCGCTAA